MQPLYNTFKISIINFGFKTSVLKKFKIESYSKKADKILNLTTLLNFDQLFFDYSDYQFTHELIGRGCYASIYKVLMDENFHPKLYDFGLTRKFPHSLNNSMLLTMTTGIGTPLYMAPELLESQEKYGSGVDVYAFAIMAYEIATAMMPSKEIPSLNQINLMRLVIEKDYRPQFPDHFNAKMKDLISRCWDKTPEMKFQILLKN